ncbi:MAG: putative bifunctional diguanylate cyclase/phosphodiesterase [Nocardioides sp.]
MAMQVWRGVLAAGVGCGIVSLAVAQASVPVAYTAPPITAAFLLGTVSLTRSRRAATFLRGLVGQKHQSSRVADRAVLQTRARQALRTGSSPTLLSVGLGGIDDVGDTLGHAARRALLAEAGRRITAFVGHGDVVARLDAEEFAVLLPTSSPERGADVAEQIRLRLREPMTVAGVSVVPSPSVGVATDATGVDELVRSATLAMHQAMNEGGDRVRIYSHQLLHGARQRLSIEGDLRRAVQSGQLCAYFQPIVDTRSGRVRSVEALVRWNHPTLGLLTPPQFLAAAEQAGLMVDIGRHVLELACGQLAAWRRRSPDLAVAVNVSEQELRHPGFPEHVLTTLNRFGLPTAALHLEVTETVAVSEDMISAALEPLTAAGVACSLDDFGTGHSSLHRLRRLPVQRLKIDKSFVSGLSSEQRAAPLLASIIAMAHGVGNVVVAEGVETREQADFLARHGCDELQGDLFSRPVPAEQVHALLQRVPTAVTAGLPAPRAAGFQ